MKLGTIGINRRTLAMTAAALVGGMAFVLFGPASPAVGFFSPPLLLDVQVKSPATLVAKGAAVDVKLEVICAGADTASVGVSLTQRAGSEIASGYGSTQIGCTNQWQTVIVTVQAQPGKAFKKGPAVADARIFGCAYYYPCGSEEDIQTIDIDQ